MLPSDSAMKLPTLLGSPLTAATDSGPPNAGSFWKGASSTGLPGMGFAPWPAGGRLIASRLMVVGADSPPPTGRIISAIANRTATPLASFQAFGGQKIQPVLRGPTPPIVMRAVRKVRVVPSRGV